VQKAMVALSTASETLSKPIVRNMIDETFLTLLKHLRFLQASKLGLFSKPNYKGYLLNAQAWLCI
jgi:hypothetical protein